MTTFLILLCTLGHTDASKSEGSLRAKESAVDLGEVRTGSPLTYVYGLVNRGAHEVRIVAAETGCGCLKPEVSRTKLQPGESSEVKLSVNTLTQPAGKNTWRIAVKFEEDDKRQSTLELTLSAVLVREISVTPPMLAISVSGPSAVSHKLTVTDIRVKPLTVVAAVSTSAKLTTTIGKPSDAAKVHEQLVEVLVSKDFPTGQTDETIVLHTDDPVCRELRVPVRIVKTDAKTIVASPDSVDLRIQPGEQEASMKILLRRSGEGNIRIDRVESSDSSIRAKWSSDSAPTALLRVTVDRGGPSGEIRVLFAEPPGQEIRIPVRRSGP